ncbi:MAG: hypothetical protein R3A52_13485 [Polyangiales bacterium]
MGYAMVTPAREILQQHAPLMAWWEKVSARPRGRPPPAGDPAAA